MCLPPCQHPHTLIRKSSGKTRVSGLSFRVTHFFQFACSPPLYFFNSGQDHCDRDTPDSFVPSSSPESVAGMEISRYPDLSLVKEEPPSPAPSPTMPMLPSASGKGLFTILPLHMRSNSYTTLFHFPLCSHHQLAQSVNTMEA